MTHSARAIRELLGTSGLAPRRDLGQNFVVDPNTVRRIAALAQVGPGDHVIEIGAGLGSLTLALAETGARVTAVEIDPGLVDALRSVIAEQSAPAESVTIHHGDARELDWDSLLESNGRATVVANLPYNIATPLVCDLLDGVPGLERMVVMVQREVAERFVAVPRTKAYGAVSVKIAYWAHARIVAQVPPSVFLPRPNVDSAVVEITRRPPPDSCRAVAPHQVFELASAGFAQRRKMLRRSLAGRVEAEQFHRAGVEPTQRAEELGPEQWCRLAAAVADDH